LIAVALLALFALAAVLLAELAIRFCGVSGFPLFRKDAQGYRMMPLQQGKFLRKFNWRYDRFGMRDDRELDSLAGYILIVGDSVVEGGNRVDQDDTLIAQLRCLTDQSLYAAACHGWSLGNELAVLQSLPGWEQARRLVFVLNTGDFDTIEPAPTQLSFPTRYPALFSLWLLGRKLYRDPRFGQLVGWRPPQRFNSALREQVLADFAQVLARFEGDVVVLRYPQRGEDPGSEPYYGQLIAAAGSHRTRLLDLAGRADWGDACYLDHIHPNPRGIKVLAQCIAEGAL
jgi:hypothetical protein